MNGGSVFDTRTHFALQHLIAPVADMLEDQQSQDRIGRRSPSSPATALGMAFRQCLVHDRDNLLICQHFIGVFHPFAKIAHFLGNQAVAKPSCSRRFSITLLPPRA
jgi:hypothetical protein